MRGLRIGDKVDSDHHPVEVEIERRRRGEEEATGRDKEGNME